MERLIHMGITRKSYAIVYLTQNTSLEDLKKIELDLTERDIDFIIIESKHSYAEWLRDKESINPSVFITNAVQVEKEFMTINEKLEGAVIILIGDNLLPNVRTAKVAGQTVEQENMLKRCKNIKDLKELFDAATPKFNKKVFASPNDPPFSEIKPTLAKEVAITDEKEPIPPTAPPNKEVQVEVSKEGNPPEKEKEQETEKVIEEPSQETIDTEQVEQTPVSTTIPIFENDEERLQDKLKTITEVANKTKAIDDKKEKGKQEIKTIKFEKKKSTPVPIEKTDSTSTTENPIVYEENPYHQRSRHLQKQVFAQQKWENTRTIGIWSPLHRMGVTSFTINFALFLAENRVYTAVLEGLTEQHALKSWLQRYSSTPANWSSYAKAIHSDGHINEIKWKYRDVLFLPLDTKDPQFEWNAMSLESYMTTTKNIDITLVDFPTGKMTSYTEDSLHYIDELWILIDDAAQETLAWKAYIQNMKQKTQIKIHLIFNKKYDFSQVKRLSKEYNLPLLTELPALHEETMRNYYETIPLYDKKEVQEKLHKPFTELAKHLLGENFIIHEKVPSAFPIKWPTKLLKILKPT